jgi:hypothetical protein
VLEISGVDHVNHTPVSQTSAPRFFPTGLRCGQRCGIGSLTIDAAPDARYGESLHLATDSNNGRLRLNNNFDADNQMTLGDWTLWNSTITSLTPDART